MFEFKVYKRTKSDGSDDYVVALPHQCDDWKITSEEFFVTQPNKAVAIQRMKNFISEAESALVELENLPDQA